MPPVQNTFCIVPDIPSALNGARDGSNDPRPRPARPPMTTKQVKKAYQKANKGPKLSKAEQRKQELFEQDRIRKEYEKEKNQARARVARDKKKERAEAERAEKRKKGLPLVDVRPSQGSIACFVRPKSKSKSEPRSQRDSTDSPLPEIDESYRSPSPAIHDADETNKADEADKENIRPSQKRPHMPPSQAVRLTCEPDPSPDPDLAEPPTKRCRIEDEKVKAVSPMAEPVESPLPNHHPALSMAAASVANHQVADHQIPDHHVRGTPAHNSQQQQQQPRPGVNDSFSTIDLNEENLFDDLFRDLESAPSGPKTDDQEKCFEQLPRPVPPAQTHEDREDDLFDALILELEDTSTINHPHVLQERFAYKSSQKPSAQVRGQSQVQDPAQVQVQAPPPKPSKDAPSSLQRLAEPTLLMQMPPPKSVPSHKPGSQVAKDLGNAQDDIPEPAKRGSTPRSSATPHMNALNSQTNVTSSRLFRHPKTPMAPPLAPPKFKTSKQDATSRFSTPQFLKPPLPPRVASGASHSSHMSGPKPLRNEPPPSTQAFLFSHLDDFLPSPSQEVREIFEEPRQGVSRGTNTKTPKSATTLPLGQRNFQSNSTRTMPTTPAIPRNTNREMARSVNSGNHHIPQTFRPPKILRAPTRKPMHMQPKPQPIPEYAPRVLPIAFEMPFFSTQDFLLSSQDVKDIEEEPLSSAKHHSPNPTPTPMPKPIPEPVLEPILEPPKENITHVAAPRPSPKPFFTSTCRELRFKCALEASRTARWEGHKARRKAQAELDRIQAEEDLRLEALLAEAVPSPVPVIENGSGRLSTTTDIDGVWIDESDTGGNDSFSARSWKTPTPTPQSQSPAHNPAPALVQALPPPPPPPRQQPQPQQRSSGSKRESERRDSNSFSKPQSTTSGNPTANPAPAKRQLKRTVSEVHQRSKPKSSGSSGYEAMLELLAKGPKQKSKPKPTKPVANEAKDGKTSITIPASQETDYDCGEEWDDDEMFFDI
ncbi:hypothetical protein F4808DRAFT_445515 [Astrocystis sublimbata]|nr:hypothetical protein F4808DRAFT_445515 [Astrocystis sublimbata]